MLVVDAQDVLFGNRHLLVFDNHRYAFIRRVIELGHLIPAAAFLNDTNVSAACQGLAFGRVVVRRMDARTKD